MRCGNFLCIYEENGQCVLKEVELDTTGQCLECLYIQPSEEIIEKLKKERLKDYL